MSPKARSLGKEKSNSPVSPGKEVSRKGRREEEDTPVRKRMRSGCQIQVKIKRLEAATKRPKNQK